MYVCNDILRSIVGYLNNFDRNIFTITCKQFNNIERETYIDKYIVNYFTEYIPYKYIKILYFHNDYNKELLTIPNSVESIIFGSNFNQELYDLRYLINLQSITFGTMFNRDINYKLPRSIKEIKFGRQFNKKINDDGLIENLKYIKLHVRCSKRNDIFKNKFDVIIVDNRKKKESFEIYYNQNVLV